ncbi:hypothetical protein [Alloprevotella tannerae]|uniref:hypothetical protein n=1 Tax=Alloprevotella tannerae TaxID=76122 RepID=UPI0028D1E302|nr:hypothetical protein [Alloprevotella tannerae]
MGKQADLHHPSPLNQPQQPPRNLNKSSGNLKKTTPKHYSVRAVQISARLSLFQSLPHRIFFLPLRFLRLVGLIHLQNNKAAALQAESITSTCWELFSAYANFNSSYGDFFLNLLEFFLHT